MTVKLEAGKTSMMGLFKMFSSNTSSVRISELEREVEFNKKLLQIQTDLALKLEAMLRKEYSSHEDTLRQAQNALQRIRDITHPAHERSQ